MENALNIAGYARISYDEDNESYDSIINQKAIIRDYAQDKFSVDHVSFFEDDNFSGYSFERPDFNKLKALAKSRKIDVIIAKDLSRIGRHNARTLLFIEEMQDIGVRVVAINDSIDSDDPHNDVTLGVKTWYNELYVKDISKKVKSSITNLQKNGKWLCAVPYGYIMTDSKNQEFVVDTVAADVIRRIFDLYAVQGWGYKKIANYLTDEGIPTPRMREKELAEQRGKTYKKAVRDTWSIISVSGILSNDFYIGTLRAGKYSRKKINGADMKIEEAKQHVFEHHHEPIIDAKLFRITQSILEKRSKNHYRGIKKYDNVYSGFVFCGNCNAPMFSISNGKRPNAYLCGTYHRRGLKGCTAHHTLESTLNAVLKNTLVIVRENAKDMIAEINKSIQKEKGNHLPNDVVHTLEKQMEQLKNELKGLKRQRIRESLQGNMTDVEIDALYNEMEDDLVKALRGLQSQIEYSQETKMKTVRMKRLAIDAMEIFNRIIEQDRFNKLDIELLVEKIIVYDDRIVVKLKPDIDSIFQLNDGGEMVVTQEVAKRTDKDFVISVINEGDPLEIFTDREGEVILKKYSPIGELSDFSKEYTESLHQALTHIACISDKDTIIAVSGAGRRELLDKPISDDLELVMKNREKVVANRGANARFYAITTDDEENNTYTAQVIVPILSEGDVIGAVILLSRENGVKMSNTELKVAETAAGFVGKQMEQ